MTSRSQARYLIGTAVLLLAVAVFQSWRYCIPERSGSDEQHATWIAQLEESTGMHLSPSTRVLLSADEDVRPDPSAQNWLIFSPVPFEGLPTDVHMNRFVQSDLSENVRVIESGIFPFRILGPRSVAYHRWTNRRTDLQAHVVSASRGWYMSLQVFPDDDEEFSRPVAPVELLHR